jgi:hypothetical protein
MGAMQERNKWGCGPSNNQDHEPSRFQDKELQEAKLQEFAELPPSKAELFAFDLPTPLPGKLTNWE